MFEGWDNYFVLLGTASAGLIGLLFVVITLTSNFERSRALWAAGIYMTPIAVHFAAVLTISAIAMVPGLTPRVVAVLVALMGLGGLAAASRTCVGILGISKSGDPPHWSDLWGYGVGPAAAYVAIVAAAAAIWLGRPWAVYALAAVLLSLLLLAIRNAWDLITWMAPQGAKPPESWPAADEPAAPASDQATKENRAGV
jgi:hypothetical protein